MMATAFVYPATLTVWAENLSEADALAAEVAEDVAGAEIGDYLPPSLDLTGEPPTAGAEAEEIIPGVTVGEVERMSLDRAEGEGRR